MGNMYEEYWNIGIVGIQLCFMLGGIYYVYSRNVRHFLLLLSHRNPYATK
jgi:hypothetical protein